MTKKKSKCAASKLTREEKEASRSMFADGFEERHDLEQYFWSQKTVKNIIAAITPELSSSSPSSSSPASADICSNYSIRTEYYSFNMFNEGQICCLATPSLAHIFWESYRRTEALLDIDTRFAYLPGFRYFDIRYPQVKVNDANNGDDGQGCRSVNVSVEGDDGHVCTLVNGLVIGDDGHGCTLVKGNDDDGHGCASIDKSVVKGNIGDCSEYTPVKVSTKVNVHHCHGCTSINDSMKGKCFDDCDKCTSTPELGSSIVDNDGSPNESIGHTSVNDNVKVNETANDEFRIVVFDPPFFYIPLPVLYEAVVFAVGGNMNTKLLIGFLKREEASLLRVFAPFKLRPTKFPLEYANVKPNKWQNYVLYSNVDLPGIKRIS